jgi:hypothetical protein
MSGSSPVGTQGKGNPPRRVFSLREANQTLPLVARIIRDIVEGHRKISELDSQAHRLAEGGQAPQAEELRDQIHDLLVMVDDYVEELHQIGCEFKDPFQGLVDFPARMGGDRLVYLCWKMGEPDIRYWHELHSGFAGRQPIDGYFNLTAPPTARDGQG